MTYIEIPRHIKAKLNGNDLNSLDTLIDDATKEAFDDGYAVGHEHGFQEGRGLDS